MICYKDRTFCASDCVNTSCHRHMSEEDGEAASKLRLPVAWADFSSECPDYRAPVKTHKRVCYVCVGIGCGVCNGTGVIDVVVEE